MSIDRTPPGGGTTRLERGAEGTRRWWVWPAIALVLIAGASLGIGSRVSESISDGRFVSAIREEDPQDWLLSMSDEGLTASGRAECASMRAGENPQDRIDSYADFNAAYLVNDAMKYYCPEQLQR